jgi:hypothetical protein
MYEEYDINEIFNNFLRTYLNIFEASFPVIYHDKDNVGLQRASGYHVNRKEV